MGYYTTFNLDAEIYNRKTGERTRLPDDMYDKINEVLGERDVLGYALTEDWDCADAVKWYEHDVDMIAVSKLFPDVLFALHGEGDGNDDLWDKYYLDGKMQCCNAEIVYPPFDPAKLV